MFPFRISSVVLMCMTSLEVLGVYLLLQARHGNTARCKQWHTCITHATSHGGSLLFLTLQSATYYRIGAFHLLPALSMKWTHHDGSRLSKSSARSTRDS